jgi:enoyl-CoA hydratase
MRGHDGAGDTNRTQGRDPDRNDRSARSAQCDDAESARALSDACDLIDGDPSIFIGILTGAGGHFCAGADLKAAAANGDSGSRTERGPMGMCQHPPAKVMIAAIEGAAAGGGFELALACHMIVAAEDARMGLPEVRRNLIANGGGLLRLPRASRPTLPPKWR